LNFIGGESSTLLIILQEEKSHRVSGWRLGRWECFRGQNGGRHCPSQGRIRHSFGGINFDRGNGDDPLRNSIMCVKCDFFKPTSWTRYAIHSLIDEDSCWIGK
jgi:hypothetical protein